MDHSDARERLQKIIAERAFVRSSDETAIAKRGTGAQVNWLFDIRQISLDSSVLDDLCTLFKKDFPDAGQIGGIETAAIPLIASLVTNRASTGGFYFRKSRKKDGLMKMIEGELKLSEPVILVDDLINSGTSLARVVEMLEELKTPVRAIWTLVRFRDLDQYKYFTDKGIEVRSIFTLDDFSELLGTKNMRKAPKTLPPTPYRGVWKFAAPEPNFFYVVPKSDPVLDAERVYVGSDKGIMWALSQENGEVAWSFSAGLHRRGKGIFSSPALYKNVVYFGAYDGNFYALDAVTGKKKWVSYEADWVGSSPAIAPEIGLVFVGLEYGLFRKRGGIAAFDLSSGKLRWSYRDMPCFTHSTPLYIAQHKQVVVGSNDGCAYLFDAQDGRLIWKTSTGILTDDELDSGFSRYDIKESFAYDEDRDRIIFGNSAGTLYSLARESGEIKKSFKADFGFYSTPLIYEDRVYATSLDKNLYCLSLETFELLWKWNAGARIFSSPVFIDGNIFVGANTGRLTEINPINGKELSNIVLTERITNKPVYNPKTKRFFVPTFANELYCIERAS